MRREQRRERAVHRRHELDRLHVRELREAEAAVLARDLDAECPQLPQPVDDVLRNLALAIDAIGVDLFTQESLEFVEEWFGASDFVRILFGVRVNQVHPQLAEKQVAYETRRGPFLFACRFGDFTRLVGADFPLFGLGEGSHAPVM